MFRYPQVEDIFGRLYGAAGAAKTGALRGRITHLRRLGLPLGVARGSGNKIAYGKEQVYEFGFCLQLEQSGVDPSLAAKLLQAHRDYVLNAYARAEREREVWFFWLVTEFMSASWSTENMKFAGLPEFQAGPMRALEFAIARLDSRQGGCLALFQVTPLVREVLQAAKGAK
jgi:hypothetical protein